MVNDQVPQGMAANRSADLAREVYGVMGIPVDVIEMSAVLRRIDSAVAGSAPFFISTSNLNFLVSSRSDTEFRESLLRSDLCTADGMPIVWIARLLGAPIKERIAGSDIFEALKSTQNTARRLRVFLFGGAKGTAAAACAKLKNEVTGMICSGSYDPGFCSVEEMSTDAIFETINSSGANFLAAALGAKKGQAWLLRNHERLLIPVRVHLGATINFQAGTLQRAPMRMRRWGLEWLWRIKEEPQLWGRYWNDGLVFLRLVLTQVLPFLILTRTLRSEWNKQEVAPIVGWAEGSKTVILSINGHLTAQNIGNAIPGFQNAVATAKSVVVDFSNARLIDTRFFGLLLMLRKRLKEQQLDMHLTGVPPRIARLFRLNGFEFLLSAHAESAKEKLLMTADSQK